MVNIIKWPFRVENFHWAGKRKFPDVTVECANIYASDILRVIKNDWEILVR